MNDKKSEKGDQAVGTSSGGAISAAVQPVASFFHPQLVLKASPEYEEFMRVRQKILAVVRTASPHQTKKVIEDIVDALLDHDKDIPTGLLAGISALIGIGKKVKARKKKRETYEKVVRAILEQIFDPGLEFKMTRKEILDAFSAKGINRDMVSRDQIEQIYVLVIDKLQVGELRDLTYEEQLFRYVKLKLTEIKTSRQDWDLNGR